MKKIINDWIKNYGNYKKEVWDENILKKLLRGFQMRFIFR